MVHTIATEIPASLESKLTRQAEKLVGQTFYGTLLKQMHDSPFKSKMFSGGRGGEAFQTMMDQRLVDRMSRSAGKKLVRSVVKRIIGVEKMKAAETPIPNNGASTGNSFGQGSTSNPTPNPFSKQSRGSATTEMRARVPVGLRA